MSEVDVDFTYEGNFTNNYYDGKLRQHGNLIQKHIIVHLMLIWEN